MKFSDYDLDMGLFLIFRSLLKYRSVSETAKQLDISQPAASRKLAKLREHFGDPLFVRTGKGLAPTPFAIDLEPSIKALLSIYQSQIQHQEEFDPLKSERSFCVAASEIGHKLLLLPLFKKCANIAPNIRFNAVRPTTDSLMEDLESGEVDAALGGYPKLYSGIFEKTLATESYVCAVRVGHPDLGGKMSTEQFMRSDHIIVSTKGLGHIHRQIEEKLYEICPRERIKIVCDSFFTAALLAEQTDCIATLPSRLANKMSLNLNLQYLEPPINFPSFDIKLYWHERFHQAPANKWLRQTISSVIH